MCHLDDKSVFYSNPEKHVEYVKNFVLQNCNCIFSTLEGTISPKNMKGLCHIAKCTTVDYSSFSSISALQRIWEAYVWHIFWKEFRIDGLPPIAECIRDTSMGEPDLFIKKINPLLNNPEVCLLLPCRRNHFLLWLTAPLVAEMTQPMWFRKAFCFFHLAKSS